MITVPKSVDALFVRLLLLRRVFERLRKAGAYSPWTLHKNARFWSKRWSLLNRIGAEAVEAVIPVAYRISTNFPV